MRDPHELAERTARFRSDAADDHWLQALNAVLAAADLPVESTNVVAADLPLIYIVGAPRSGTTLLSQLASRFLEVGYINNLIARFWQRPSVGIRLSRLVCGERSRNEIHLQSEHGSTSGAAGPHEFGFFWRHWLHLDQEPTHHLRESAVAGLDLPGLRRQLEREILAPFGRAVVFKNVICGLNAAMLAAVHPRSLFVHITRDRAATCASILQTRMQRYGSYDTWWSLKPATFPEILPLAAAAQVVRQVDDCRREIAAELQRPGVRGLTVEYEAVCSDPSTTLARIVEAAQGDIEILEGLPAALHASRGPELPSALQDHLHAALL